MATYSIKQKYLRENIALLSILRKEPGKAEENPIPQHLLDETDDSPRQLSFERERDIVDDLVFLTASSEDATDVIAICVEERPHVKALSIRVAINKGSLKPFKKGLNMIALALQQIAREGLVFIFSGLGPMLIFS